MKLLITGATGFIGSCLVKKLADSNKIYALVRPGSNTKALDKRVKVFKFTGEQKKLEAFLNKEKFDGVIHLASLFLVSHKDSDIPGLVDSNLLFPTILLDACVNAQVPWFINTGTFTQHYQNKNYSPVNLYSATKQAFQDVAQFYLETAKINFVTIKLFDTFGPGDTRPKVFSLWKKISESGESLDMSPGKQIVDMNYVEDVADGFIQMAKLLCSKKGKGFKGKVFSLSSGSRMTLQSLAKVFQKVSGRKLNINWGKRPYRNTEVMVPWKNFTNVPGWKPKVSLEQAIKKTLAS